MAQVLIWTDGSCLPNKIGGWAVIIEGEKRIELSGQELNSTSNRMELYASIKALEYLPPSFITLHTDSQYLREGITLWIKAWLNNGWLTTVGKQVKNRDLWELLLIQESRHKITWIWEKGHNGSVNNELCDLLAYKAAKGDI